MRMFIPSVLSALKALLKLPHWFLWKILRIFLGWEKSISPQRPPSDSYPPYSPHDSNGIPSQRRLLSTHRQPPQSRPAGGDYAAPSQSLHYQTSPRSYQSHHQPNQRPTGVTPQALSNTSVTRLFERDQSPSIVTAPPAISHEDHVSLGLATGREITEPPTSRSQQNDDISQDQRPAVLKGHSPSEDHQITASRSTSETQSLSLDREQSQDDRTRYQDKNQLNRNNKYYTSLRADAKQEGSKMAKCFRQSDKAYARGQDALGEELLEQGMRHERTRDTWNAAASAWIFPENNPNSESDEIDLHGLFVQEAISYSEEAIENARQRGDSQIRLIVGKGLHSQDNIAKIRPALEEWTREHNLPAERDPDNEGVLIVQLA